MSILEECRIYSYSQMVQQECAHHILSVGLQMAMHETTGFFLLAQLNNFPRLPSAEQQHWVNTLKAPQHKQLHTAKRFQVSFLWRGPKTCACFSSNPNMFATISSEDNLPRSVLISRYSLEFISPRPSDHANYLQRQSRKRQMFTGSKTQSKQNDLGEQGRNINSEEKHAARRDHI